LIYRRVLTEPVNLIGEHTTCNGAFVRAPRCGEAIRSIWGR